MGSDFFNILRNHRVHSKKKKPTEILNFQSNWIIGKSRGKTVVYYDNLKTHILWVQNINPPKRCFKRVLFYSAFWIQREEKQSIQRKRNKIPFWSYCWCFYIFLASKSGPFGTILLHRNVGLQRVSVGENYLPSFCGFYTSFKRHKSPCNIHFMFWFMRE